MLAHTIPTPTDAANAHTCTCAAQRRNLQTFANVRLKHVHNVCVSLLHHSLESIAVVTRWEGELDPAQVTSLARTIHSHTQPGTFLWWDNWGHGATQTCVSVYSSHKYNLLLKLTFDSDVDGLCDEELWLDQHAADVSPLIHPLLNITELQRSVLKHHLSRWKNL